jgi:hypothetical protein
MKRFDQEIIKVLIRKNYYNIDTEDIRFNQIYNDFGPNGEILIVSRIEIPHATLGHLDLKTFTKQSDYDVMARDKKLTSLLDHNTQTGVDPIPTIFNT